MASSTESLGLQYQFRSISLPSRLHPNSIETGLNKMKTPGVSSFSTVGSALSAEGLRVGVVQPAELYNSVEELLHSPLNQQALLQQQGVLVEEALEASIGLIELCGTIRDLFMTMKENVQNLQSALRRKGGDSSTESNIRTYICSRKKVKKDAAKSLRVMKQMENSIEASMLLDGNHHLSMVIQVLREVTAVTICFFRSLFLFLSVPAGNIKPSGWSLIKKLTKTDSAPSEGSQMMINEVGRVDLALSSLQIPNNNSKFDDHSTQKRLQTLDASIGGLEAGLDSLFRRLIQSRVSLLNILAH